jgi:hypothetical protein
VQPLGLYEGDGILHAPRLKLHKVQATCNRRTTSVTRGA